VLIRSLLTLAVLAVLCGCPSTPPPPNPDAGPTAFVGRTCNVDAECGTLRCDKIRHQCICLSDESCKSSDPNAPQQYCNNYTGLCVSEISGCTADSQCGMTQYCDPSIRACRPLKSFCEPCAADNECGGAGDNCILDTNLMEKFCGTACMVDADCPRGASCQQKGTKNNGMLPDGGLDLQPILQCWPSESSLPGQTASCKNFKGCTPDSLRTCNTDMDCGDASQRCDPAQGKCVAIEQVCPFGTTCDPRAKICVADCAVDADCGDPKLICQDKVCVIAGECTTDTDCPANKVCNVPPGELQGSCAPFCQGDVDCPIGQTCQMTSGGRYECAPGCATTQNCPLDQRCNAMHQCEGPVVGGATICQTTSACDTCQICDPMTYQCASATTAFPHCASCTTPSECGGGTCVQIDDGRFCLRYCVTGSECPQGFVCLGLTGSTQSVCVPSSRTCTGKCP
jgi:hypothetical protein